MRKQKRGKELEFERDSVKTNTRLPYPVFNLDSVRPQLVIYGEDDVRRIDVR